MVVVISRKTATHVPQLEVSAIQDICVTPMQPRLVLNRIPLRVDALIEDVSAAAAKPNHFLSQAEFDLCGQTTLTLVPQRVSAGNRARDALACGFNRVLAHRLRV